MEDDIYELQKKVKKLERELAAAERDRMTQLIDSRVFERMVDKLAELGLIDSNPHSKMLYLTGKREL